MNQDTIAAISTAPGVGGIAVVRVAGSEAFAIVDKIWRGRHLAECTSHSAHLGMIIDPTSGDILDQCVATVFKGPGSYTGDDTVELSVHGSRYVQSELLRLLIDNGCRLAEPGEFTRRAFVAGHLDLAEAEGVADLIAATSRNSHHIAMNQMRGHLSATLNDLRSRLLHLASLIELELDFSEEDVELASRLELSRITGEVMGILSQLTKSFATARAIKDGVPMAIVGAPNAGKSTLLNTLVKEDRAIVSPIAGTTRDTIEDTIEIGGTLFRIIDTAGLRADPGDEIETIGIERTTEAIKKARIVVWVVDPSSPEILPDTYSVISGALPDDASLIVAINKSDLYKPTDILSEVWEAEEKAEKILHITANTQQGILGLTDYLGQKIDKSTLDTALLTNARHYQAASLALQSMANVDIALQQYANQADNLNPIPLDLVAIDLRAAIHHLGEITGTITTPDILANIFAHFCIGK